MYSSIEDIERAEVIKKCYWPIFKLVKKGIPVCIESPAVTLEIIKDLDPEWFSIFTKYVTKGNIEFIGSGYSQLIGPLVPAVLNKWNQRIGKEIYEQLLGKAPAIALINEMAFSQGILEHYIDCDYKAIIMEWNNPKSVHSSWKKDWKNFPQKAILNKKLSIPVIWSDSIVFQKFQRYVHGEYDFDKYLEFIKSHNEISNSYFPLYSNDLEIFDFRPGRFKTESKIKNKSEWKRIIKLYEYLNNQKWCDLIFVSDALEGLKNKEGGNKISLESQKQPIPVKKQEKYNVIRWALSGRNDLEINSKCYEIFDKMVYNKINSFEKWKELCYLWSSDFRTHITKKRWSSYKKRLENFTKFFDETILSNSNKHKKNNPIHLSMETENEVKVGNGIFSVVFNKKKGLAIKSFNLGLNKNPLFGTLDHGYYDDISFAADFFSGHSVIEKLGEHKIADLDHFEPELKQSESELTLIGTQKNENYFFEKKATINNECLVLEKNIKSESPGKIILRPFHFTFNPEFWNKDSLYVETHNGGTRFERFFLNGQDIHHGNIYSPLISSRHCFGNTEGILLVGDKNQSIQFECTMSISSLIPSIIFKEVDDTFFFRLQYSASEIDDTLKSRNILVNSKLTISSSLGSK